MITLENLYEDEDDFLGREELLEWMHNVPWDVVFLCIALPLLSPIIALRWTLEALLFVVRLPLRLTSYIANRLEQLRSIET